MGFVEALWKQFPELAQSFKGDTMLLNAKDINEVDHFGLGDIDDVVLYLLFQPDANLKQRVEGYIRQIRPAVKRIIFSY